MTRPVARRFFYPALALVWVLAWGSALAQAVLPRDVRQEILRAVVQVQAYDIAADRIIGAGSGSIISPDGFVLTNFHVVEGPGGQPLEWHAILVTDPDAPDLLPSFQYWARYIAGDPTYDLAILQIVEYADETPVPAGTTFPFVTLGDSGVLIPGDPITVVGYPGISGDTITFTSGVVSGFLGEDLTAGGKQWIKTDAKLARGNSGGAAFDENGLLIGIPTLRTQTTDGDYIEQQDYLRPLALALPLIQAHVPNVARVGGLGASVAGAGNPLAPGSAASPGLRPAQPERTPDAATRPAAPAAGQPHVEIGALGPEDMALDSGEYLDVYLVGMTAGTPVRIEISSDVVDPYLLVLDPTDNVVFEVDDSSGAGLNVAETFTPATSGEFLVVVTSAFGYEVGGYELRIQGGEVLSGDLAPADGDGGPSAAVGDDVRTGALGAGDEQLSSGEYFEVVTLDLAAGVPVTVSLSSDDFDPYLGVLDPNGEVVFEVDDSEGAFLGVLESFVPSLGGPYDFVVTSAFPNETGAYELRVSSEASTGADDGFQAVVSTGPESGFAGELRPGQFVTAELAGADDAWAFHTYRIDVPAGTDVLTVRLIADEDLDLFLKFGSEIASYAEDGDWGYRDIELSNQATLSIRAPQAGSWFVDVAWVIGDSGAMSGYELSVE